MRLFEWLSASLVFAAGCTWGSVVNAPVPMPVPDKVTCMDVLASDELVLLRPRGWDVRAGGKHLFYLTSYDQYLAILQGCRPYT